MSPAPADTGRGQAAASAGGWPSWVLGAAGVVGLAGAFLLRPATARAAVEQVWPAFVLVAGLLLIGLAAADDGLFAAAGDRLARLSRSRALVFAGSAALLGIVTALLNLDTAVAFLTPVMVFAARSRGDGMRSLVYGSLLLANAGSLFLPGSNLTNLIVLGHLHLGGSRFLARMWAPALAALIVTALVVAFARLRPASAPPMDGQGSRDNAPTVVVGAGSIAVAGAVVALLVVPDPALPVAALGVAAATVHALRRPGGARRAWEVLGLPVLGGLFGVAVALGTLGRLWHGPSLLLLNLGSWETAAAGALGSVAINNLPAASLFAAVPPPHPFALLIGLNLGPNLCVTGSLAWFLWFRAARTAGMTPRLRTASLLGVIAVPLSMAAALGALALTGAA